MIFFRSKDTETAELVEVKCSNLIIQLIENISLNMF